MRCSTCRSLHLLSNKLLPGTTSLPISYNGILIDTHLKTLQWHQCKGRRQVRRACVFASMWVLAPDKWLMEGGASREVTERERTQETDTLMCHAPEVNQDDGTSQDQIPVFSRVLLHLYMVAVCISRSSSDWNECNDGWMNEILPCLHKLRCIWIVYQANECRVGGRIQMINHSGENKWNNSPPWVLGKLNINYY